MIRVAPHAGARIETTNTGCNKTVTTSLPTRERGLKLGSAVDLSQPVMSLPTRERGLKPWLVWGLLGLVIVAPHAGARIET